MTSASIPGIPKWEFKKGLRPSESRKAVELLVDVGLVVVVRSEDRATCIVLYERINGYVARYRSISCDGWFPVMKADEVGLEERALDGLRRGVNLVLALGASVVVVVVKDVVVFIKGNVFDEVNGRVSGFSGANCRSASWLIG